MATSYTNVKEISGLRITSAAPVDDRLVVNSVEDLTNLYNKTTNPTGLHHVYTGLVVNIKGTSDLYVLVGTAKQASNLNYWKKVGGSDFVPEDYVEYYASQFGAKIFNSAEDLVSNKINFAYKGMFAVVRGGQDSEDESGLYVLLNTPNTLASNWMKISGGSGSSQNVEITTDGTMPASGNGISLSSSPEDAFIEDVYVDDGFEAGKYYTSNGINSYAINGGDKLDDTDYIILTNGGESYIKLFSGENESGNWIELNIVDDSLGFTKEDVTYLDDEGVEHSMTEGGDTLSLQKGSFISFGDSFVDFSGMEETRNNDNGRYTFGSTGSTYDDIDIYTTNVLPTVYAYSNGTPVKILTEGDKSEILNIINDSIEPEAITEAQIFGLFENEDI